MEVEYNRLTELPSLTNNVALRVISANGNQLQRLPNLKTNVDLVILRVYMNRLTKYVCDCTRNIGGGRFACEIPFNSRTNERSFFCFSPPPLDQDAKP